MISSKIATGPIAKADRRDPGSNFARIVLYCAHKGRSSAAYHFEAPVERVLDAVAEVGARKDAAYVGVLLTIDGVAERFYLDVAKTKAQAAQVTRRNPHLASVRP